MSCHTELTGSKIEKKGANLALKAFSLFICTLCTLEFEILLFTGWMSLIPKSLNLKQSVRFQGT